MKAPGMLAAVLLVGCGSSSAPPPKAPSRPAATLDARWSGLAFLVGDWVAAAAPGEPTGSFSFAPELGGHVLVRHNHAEFAPPSGETSGKVHDDLVVVYGAGETLRADYFDDEGRSLRYVVTTTPGHAVFETESGAPGPRFRLTYDGDTEAVAVAFAFAPPGGDYVTHLTGHAVRRH